MESEKEEIKTAMPEEVVENKQEEQKDENTIPCPCCGKSTLHKPVKIKDEMLDHYMSCILTGVPFWHAYPLYDGKLTVKIGLLTREQLDLINRVARLCIQAREYSRIPQEDIDIVQRRTRLFMHIQGIDTKVNTVAQQSWQPSAALSEALPAYIDKLTKLMDELRGESKDAEAYKDAVTATKDIFHAMSQLCSDTALLSSVPEALLAVALDTHNQIYGILVSAGIDVNFWEGIELG